MNVRCRKLILRSDVMNIIIEQLDNSEASYSRFVKYIYKVEKLFHTPLSAQGDLDVFARKWLSKAIVLVAVDTDTGIICGSMVTYANDLETRRAFTTLKVVSEGYQRNGIAKMLRAKMCEIAKNEGMTVMRGKTHKDNIASINDIIQAGGRHVGYIEDKNSINYGDLIFEITL
jgi:L-amino acid N-acyltransferase YncA